MIKLSSDIDDWGHILYPTKIVEISDCLIKVLSKGRDELPKCYEYQAPYHDGYYAHQRFWIHPEDWTEEEISVYFPALKFIDGGRLKIHSALEYYEEIVFEPIKYVCQKAIELNQYVRIYFA